MAAELRKLGAAVVEGADFIEVTPPRALAAGGDPHLRRPPHGDVPVAGRLQPAGRRRARCRCASSTRAAWPRPSPTTSRRCSAWPHAAPDDVPVITIDGPTASGKGTLAAARGRARWATTCSTPARCTAPPALAAQWDGVSPDDEAARWRGWPARWTCASTAAARWLRGRDVSDELRLEARRRCWPRASRRCPAVREALHGAAAGLPPRPGPGGRRARHGHRGLPRRGAQGVPHRQRRRARRAAA